MNPTHELPFNAQAVPPVEHDKRLVRRYLLQSVLRMAAWQILAMVILIGPLLLLLGQTHDLLNPAAWGPLAIFNVLFYPIVSPAILASGSPSPIYR